MALLRTNPGGAHANVRVFCLSAYLLIFRSRCNNVVHQDGDQLCYSMNPGGKGPIRGREARSLALGFRLVQPLPRYRVYDVEYS